MGEIAKRNEIGGNLILPRRGEMALCSSAPSINQATGDPSVLDHRKGQH